MMRFHICATLSAFLLLTPLTSAHAGQIIEVNQPKPKPKPKPKETPKKEESAPPPKAKSFEMRLQMSDNQVAREASSKIFKRFEQYGFQMAPDIVFGQIPIDKKKDDKSAVVFTNTFFFEIAKFDDNCFVVAKVMDADLRSKIWTWETHENDGSIPCDVQMKIAIKDYAWKNPPLKQADDFVAIESDIDAVVQKIEIDKKNREEARKVAEAAEAEEQARRAAQEAERRNRPVGDHEVDRVNLPEYGKQQGGLGCTAVTSAPFLPAVLALALGAFRRRKK